MGKFSKMFGSKKEKSGAAEGPRRVSQFPPGPQQYGQTHLQPSLSPPVNRQQSASPAAHAQPQQYGIGYSHPMSPPAAQHYAPPAQNAFQASQPEAGEPFRSRADQCVQNNDFNRAVIMYDEALLIALNDVGLLLSRSAAHISCTPPRLDLALKDADSVIQVDPMNWRGWWQKGQLLSQMSDLQGAEEALQNAAGFSQGFDRSMVTTALNDLRRRRGQQQQQPSIPPAPSIPHYQESEVIPPSENSSPFVRNRTPQPYSSHNTTTRSSTVSSPQPTSTNWTETSPANNPLPATGPSYTNPVTPAVQPLYTQSPTITPTVTPQALSQTIIQPATQVTAPTTISDQPTRQNTTELTASALNDLLGQLDLGSANNAHPPPPYQPNLRDPTQLQKRLTELEVALKVKNKGCLSIKVYNLPGKIEAIRLLYVGLTQAELTAREYQTPTYLHSNFSKMGVGIMTYPGITFIDMDAESSASYEGKGPGTLTISGYSEEYRAHQLALKPLLNYVLEGSTVLPDVPIGAIVDRLRKLRLQPTLEDNVGLKDMLGLSELITLQYGFNEGGSRVKQITYICLSLTRSLYDAPTRFIDCSKSRFFADNAFTSTGPGIGKKNFFFQILIGAELLIRLRKEPVTTDYTGLMSDAISGLVVLAALFMENVTIQGPKAGVGKDDPTGYTLFASRNEHQAEALVRFAEAMEWPFMDEARAYIEGAYDDMVARNPIPSWDIYDWLFGLVLPGKLYRHRIMSCLVHSSPTIRATGSAPYYDNGLVVKDKSYWPRRSVLGRVLGSVKGVKSVCGWIGPLPAPKGDLKGWIRLRARTVDIPTPVLATNNRNTFEDLGFEDPGADADRADAFLQSFTDPDEWIKVTPPTTARHPGAASKVELLAINLTSVAPYTAPDPTRPDLPTEEYRPSLDFQVGATVMSFILYSNPAFVMAPPCVGQHVMHQRQMQKYKENLILAVDLKSKYPANDKVIVIDAMGEGEEMLARAWCAERGRHAIIRKGEDCCFSCAEALAVAKIGLGVNVMIMCQ